ncbi:MAG: ASCH domain-containing protein [Xenococcaceae cyanobacterium]
MLNRQKLQLFWQAYLATLPTHHPHLFQPLPDAWCFGGCPQMADRLSNLVVRGIKTATCSRYFGENILDSMGLSIILDGNENPLCIIETYEITVRRYQDIDEEFAIAEGEGDLSLDYWRKAHWNFFSREAEKENYEINENMLLLCERFFVLYSFPPDKIDRSVKLNNADRSSLVSIIHKDKKHT